jgi:hypothetical protein
MKVLKITHSRLKIERVFKDLYPEIHREFLDENDILLPTFEDIQRNFQHPDDVRILLEDIVINIETDTENICVKLKKGFMTDFGSVPKIARGIVPYDDIKYIIAYLAHDGFFGGNYGFTHGNVLLREMLRYKKVAWRKLNYVYYAVKMFGVDAYKKTQYQLQKEKRFITILRVSK